VENLCGKPNIRVGNLKN